MTNNTCSLCPLSDCHGYDETQINRAVNSQDTSVKCPLILARILDIEGVVEWWAGKVKGHIMAIKWMERYCDQMISRIEWRKENEKRQLGMYHSNNNHTNGNGRVSG